MSNRQELTDYPKSQIKGQIGTIIHIKIGEELSILYQTVTSLLQYLVKYKNQENLL